MHTKKAYFSKIRAIFFAELEQLFSISKKGQGRAPPSSPASSRPVNVDKAHGHDNISIKMLKICDTVIVELLSIIINSFRIRIMFPDILKKSNICPIHKKGEKQTINNYRSASLLPTCKTTFGRIIFNSLYEYIEGNKLLSVINPQSW